MTTDAPPDPRLTGDSELRRLLAVVVDTDRGESPFGWSELPSARPQHTETRCPQ
ncbi:hypothetical protein [Streptomyces sp. NPDC005148]